MRDWFRRILRRNSDKKINVTSVEDPVLLAILKGKKFVLPPATDMEARLRAVNCALDDEFPELESPRSIPPTPSSTPTYHFPKSFAAVASSPPSGVAGPSTAPELPLELPLAAAASAPPAGAEPAQDRGDCTRDPLILKMYNMMSSWDDRIKKLEDRDARRADEEETVRSPSRQASVDLVEKVFSPRNSPVLSPVKGLKSVADERRALKRGRDQGSISPPSKVPRATRETSLEKIPSVSGTITSESSVSTVIPSTTRSVVVSAGGGLHIRLLRILL